MWFGVITLFPEMFAAINVSHGMTGRAVNQGLIQLETWNPRDLHRIIIAVLMNVLMVVGLVWLC
jgi:tRNA (guanine-N1)-methyltransferase